MAGGLTTTSSCFICTLSGFKKAFNKDSSQLAYLIKPYGCDAMGRPISWEIDCQLLTDLNHNFNCPLITAPWLQTIKELWLHGNLDHNCIKISTIRGNICTYTRNQSYYFVGFHKIMSLSTIMEIMKMWYRSIRVALTPTLTWHSPYICGERQVSTRAYSYCRPWCFHFSFRLFSSYPWADQRNSI